MNPIILDKCFLQGSSAEALHALSEHFLLFMPDVLFYELISSDEPGRTRCFRKLPQEINPIPITKHVGALLHKELTTHEPSGLPSDNLEDIDYRFNPGLAEGSYELSGNDKSTLIEIESELESDISALISKSQTLETIFPDICKGPTKENITEAEDAIASDEDGISKFVSSLELPGDVTMPDQEILNSNWALFRWIQVQLLFSLDMRVRYGNIDLSTISKKQKIKIEHDVLDAHYLVLGVLQGAFATKETKLQGFFNVLCKDGVLITE